MKMLKNPKVAAKLLWRPRDCKRDRAFTLKQMIEFGKFPRFDREINEENFPIIIGEGIESQRIHFFSRRFGLEVDTLTALKRIGKRGGVPIGIEWLLALGAKVPWLQRASPIVALGSWCKSEFMGRDGFAVPLLVEIGNERELSLTRCYDVLS